MNTIEILRLECLTVLLLKPNYRARPLLYRIIMWDPGGSRGFEYYPARKPPLCKTTTQRKKQKKKKKIKRLKSNLKQVKLATQKEEIKGS